MLAFIVSIGYTTNYAIIPLNVVDSLVAIIVYFLCYIKTKTIKI